MPPSSGMALFWLIGKLHKYTVHNAPTQTSPTEITIPSMKKLIQSYWILPVLPILTQFILRIVSETTINALCKTTSENFPRQGRGPPDFSQYDHNAPPPIIPLLPIADQIRSYLAAKPLWVRACKASFLSKFARNSSLRKSEIAEVLVWNWSWRKTWVSITSPCTCFSFE